MTRKSAKWTQRLEADSMKLKSKQLIKISSGNAILTFNYIVRNAKAYDNQIETLISAVGHCQDLSLDIMAFTIAKHIADNTEPTLD